MFISKKKNTKKTHIYRTFTARARTCGRAVDLPHVRLCRAASLSKNLDLSSHTHLCGFLKKRDNKEEETPWKWLTIVSSIHPLAPNKVNNWFSTKKKKGWTLGQQKVLKFYLSFLSTRVLELSWVEYYDPRCTQLNSTQPPVILNSTQSNQVGSWSILSDIPNSEAVVMTQGGGGVPTSE